MNIEKILDSVPKRTNYQGMSGIAGKLNKLMSDKGVTILELAKDSGVSEATIRNIKYGKSLDPAFSVVIKLAEALGVTVLDFVPDKNSQNSVTLLTVEEERLFQESIKSIVKISKKLSLEIDNKTHDILVKKLYQESKKRSLELDISFTVDQQYAKKLVESLLTVKNEERSKFSS